MSKTKLDVDRLLKKLLQILPRSKKLIYGVFLSKFEGDVTLSAKSKKKLNIFEN